MSEVEALRARVSELEAELEAIRAAHKPRSRPEKTVTRDSLILEFIAERTKISGSTSRGVIAELLSIDGRDVYGSLSRLRKDGKIVKDGQRYYAVGVERAMSGPPAEATSDASAEAQPEAELQAS